MSNSTDTVVLIGLTVRYSSSDMSNSTDTVVLSVLLDISELLYMYC
jgi:hypothetical protein